MAASSVRAGSAQARTRKTATAAVTHRLFTCHSSGSAHSMRAAILLLIIFQPVLQLLVAPCNPFGSLQLRRVAADFQPRAAACDNGRYDPDSRKAAVCAPVPTFSDGGTFSV